MKQIFFLFTTKIYLDLPYTLKITLEIDRSKSFSFHEICENES